MNLFDVIGPVMIGPSSSHTAGAVRVGRLALAILGERPEMAEILLHGSFAETGRGHGTDKALMAGILGMSPDDARIPQALELAKEQGLQVSWGKINLGKRIHPNAAKLRLVGKDREVSLVGTSVGGGKIEVIDVDGFSVQLDGDYPTLLAMYLDRPGIIAKVSGVLAAYEINIAEMKVSRLERGREALMVIETDQRVPDKAVDQLSAMREIEWSRFIEAI